MGRQQSARQTALVISGGGSKGAFAVGVVKNLYERFRADGWFSFIGGCSTGALITPMVGLMAAPEEISRAALATLVHEYENTETQDVLTRRTVPQLLRSRESLYSFAPLRARVERVLRQDYFDWLANDGAPYCYVEYTNFRSGRIVVASPKDRGMTRARFIDALIASASVPVIVEATLIDGEPCYDGGVRDVIPVETAVDLGAEAILPIVLDPSPIGEYEGSRRLDRTFYRSIMILLDETLRNDIETARLVNTAVNAKREVLESLHWNPLVQRRVSAIFERAEYRKLFGADKRLIHILEEVRPELPLTDEPLKFEPALMRRWLRLGELAARRTITRSPFVPQPKPRAARAPHTSRRTA